MTGDIVNLKRFRKQAARVERAREAEANRAKFGEKKADRKAREAIDKLAVKRLDSHRREDK
ncbi:MAG: DUF4169 family protein [Rhizobiales bacterium]|nr:DUF4169 family protein [Hyphomicrobiales bacterium]